MSTDSTSATPTSAAPVCPFINDSGIDLSVLQIFPENCPGSDVPSLLHACAQSRVFNGSELDFIDKTLHAGLDVKDLKTLATQLMCHFSVKSFDPNVTDHKKQMKTVLDTRTCEACRDIPLDRHVPLVLILGHFVLNTRIFATTYYVRHKTELDQKYPEMNMTVRQRIRTIGKDGRPRFSTEGTSVVNLLRNLFEQHLLRIVAQVPPPEPGGKNKPRKKEPKKDTKKDAKKEAKEPKKETKKDTKKENKARFNNSIRVPVHRSPPVSDLAPFDHESSDFADSDDLEDICAFH